MNLGIVVLILVVSVITLARYLLMGKTRRKMIQHYDQNWQEQETFLKTFNVSPFDDFSAFNFRLGHFSHVSPFPKLIEDEWRYIIFLGSSEADDIATITHELSECAIGSY
jgi:hypothetical protein